jgi:HEAT repeat protein
MISQNELRAMANNSPANLVALIESGALGNVELTFAAEYLGKATAAEGVVLTLLVLLRHPNALVREGALYGLSEVRNDQAVIDAVTVVRDGDPSSALRSIAESILEELTGESE